MSLVLGAALLGGIFDGLYGVNQLLRQEENVIFPESGTSNTAVQLALPDSTSGTA